MPLFFPVSGSASGLSGSTTGYDVYIIAGQSNATSIAEDETIDERLDWTHDRIWQWAPIYETVDEAYQHKLIKAVDPLLFPENFLSGGVRVSPGSVVAREILPYTSKSRDIVLIPGAMPGVGLVNGSWQYPDGELFVATKNAAVACIETLRAEGKDARLRGIIWVQGENEAQSESVTPEEYETELPITLNALRDEVPFSDGAFVVVGQMNPDWIAANEDTTQALAIDAVHRSMPGTIDRCFFVHGPLGALATDDPIHYGIAGQRAFGKRMVIKARTTAMRTNGAGMKAPTGLRAVGPMILFTVPEGDAPLFAIDYRDAGSTDPFTRILFSPPDYYLPGDEVAYSFGELSGNIEVRVAGYMAGEPGPFTDLITLNWVTIPNEWADLDFENQTVSTGKVTSVPSIGTNTTAWTAPSGKEPTPATINGHEVLQTTNGNSLLVGPTLPLGAYTFIALVKHTNLNAAGAYFSTVEFLTRYLLWRGNDGSDRVLASMNGNGNIIDSGHVIEAGKWYAVCQSFDPAAPAGERIKLYVNGELKGQGNAVLWQEDTTGITLNALGGTVEGDGNQGGNNGLYADVKVWTSALTDQQIAQASVVAAAQKGVLLG